MYRERVPMWQTQSVGPVRTAHISVLLTVNTVSHNPAQNILIIFSLSLQTITITQMSSGVQYQDKKNVLRLLPKIYATTTWANSYDENIHNPHEAYHKSSQVFQHKGLSRISDGAKTAGLSFLPLPSLLFPFTFSIHPYDGLSKGLPNRWAPPWLADKRFLVHYKSNITVPWQRYCRGFQIIR